MHQSFIIWHKMKLLLVPVGLPKGELSITQSYPEWNRRKTEVWLDFVFRHRSHSLDPIPWDLINPWQTLLEKERSWLDWCCKLVDPNILTVLVSVISRWRHSLHGFLQCHTSLSHFKPYLDPSCGVMSEIYRFKAKRFSIKNYEPEWVNLSVSIPPSFI